MREYVVLPGAWRDEPDPRARVTARSLDHAEELPPKEQKGRKRSSRAKPLAGLPVAAGGYEGFLR